MRKILTFMGLLSVLGSSALGASQDDKAPAGSICVLKVSGMSCGACAARVQKEARRSTV